MDRSFSDRTHQIYRCQKGGNDLHVQRQRRAHATILHGDADIEQAVRTGVADKELGVLTFKGIKSLIISPTLSSNPTTLTVLMKGTGRLGIAHPEELGQDAIKVLVRQLHKRRIIGPLLVDALRDIGDIGVKNEDAAKLAWPVLQAYFKDQKIKGESIADFFADSGEMADKWKSLRAAILSGLADAVENPLIASNPGYLKTAFEAVKIAAKADPVAGAEFCVRVQQAVVKSGEESRNILEETAIHFLNPVLDAQELMDLFEQAALGKKEASVKIVAIRDLLRKADDVRIVAGRANKPLTEAFDNLWIAHAYNQQTNVEIENAQIDVDQDILYVHQQRDKAIQTVKQTTSQISHRILQRHDNIVSGLETEIDERTETAIREHDKLFVTAAPPTPPAPTT